jgi:hypothetical protein
LSSLEFIFAQIFHCIPNLLRRDTLLSEMVQEAARSGEARQYLFAKPLLW